MQYNKKQISILFLSLILISCFGKNNTPDPSPTPDNPEGLQTKYNTKLKIPNTNHYIIYVSKQTHTLSVYKHSKEIKKYKTNIRSELPDRLSENDGQTPEGIFPIYQLAIVSDPPWSRWIAFNQQF